MNTLSGIIDNCLTAAYEVFPLFSELAPAERADLMRNIAASLDQNSTVLVNTAGKETHLPEVRLLQELKRTVLQWNQYADACEKGDWLHLIIDTAMAGKPQPDLRKMNRALGPVVVFGASNFPFAYSTPGGDTASALAAGCPVIVKAHPAHPQTSAIAATIIREAVKTAKLPEAVFSLITESSFEAGQLLVQHPLTAAVGFTGSYSGGKALFDLAAARKKPIPVFSEMGSVNPVLLLPGAVAAAEKNTLAKKLVDSLTASAGQFCTNPGIWIVQESQHTTALISELRQLISAKLPEPMLHEGISKQFAEKRTQMLQSTGVSIIGESAEHKPAAYSHPTIATVNGNLFLSNKMLSQEVFGPFALLVTCSGPDEMTAVVHALEGQLTATIWGEEADTDMVIFYQQLLREKCGRIIFNGVPTGVTVVHAMHHGGPFPATTDSRYTAVGADSILRFVRPVCYQNWPDNLLPEPLRNRNSYSVSRLINGIRTTADNEA